MTSMRMGQMQKLCIEIYKTLSSINPRHMQKLFKREAHLVIRLQEDQMT